jgi:cyclophilin family peptidyl-prolyl cis-trans isomerase
VARVRSGRHFLVDSAAVPSADKRQRKKENARAAREARQAAEKRRKRNRTIRNVVIVTAFLVGVFALISFLTRDDNKKKVETTNSSSSTTSTTIGVSAADFKVDPAKTYNATITTNLGTIGLKLDTKKAPVAAGHFIKLAKAGFYNGSRWHRIVKDFVIQGGAPKGDITKNYGKPVVGELPTNNYAVGVVAAAKTGQDPPGTFDSQFFIVTGADQGKSLPNEYASFGNVTSGMDVVKKIEALPVDKDSDPGKGKATIETIAITESGGPG